MPEQTTFMDFSGQTAVITGGAGHIATEYCRLFAERGGRCVILDLDAEKISRLLDSLPTVSRGKHLGRAVNMGLEAEIAASVDWIKSDVKAVDILVNNAAFTGDSNLQGWVTDFDSQSIEAWNRALAVNLTSCFQLSQALAPMLRSSQAGCVVNIASIYGVLGPDLSLYEGTAMGNPAAYAASKGGLVQLTRWLATVLAPDVRVNCVSAGGIERGQDPRFIDRYNAKVPLGRMGTERDIAGALLYLSSDMSSYITGQNLLVDGGFSAW